MLLDYVYDQYDKNINTKTYSENNCKYYLEKYFKHILLVKEAPYGYFIKNEIIYIIIQEQTQQQQIRWVICLISLNGPFTIEALRENVAFLLNMGSERYAIKRNNEKKKKVEMMYKNLHVHRYSNTDSKWNKYALGVRSMASIYLPTQTLRDIKHDIESFIRLRSIYERYMVPYKKGILLHGPPDGESI